ncbi:MAG: hypothetical protein QN597_09985, partial [Nitrososphaeraceae archaeon]|nr:hypothetical protein [Nitrososphaeraceae archaeon]
KKLHIITMLRCCFGSITITTGLTGSPHPLEVRGFESHLPHTFSCLTDFTTLLQLQKYFV